MKKLPHFLDKGEHSCAFYQNEGEKLRIILPFIRAGLILCEKCVLITSLTDFETVKKAIQNSKGDGLLVDEEKILHIDSSVYLTAFRSGTFSGLGVQWRQMVEGFLAEGYMAVRGVGCLETEYSPELEAFLLGYERTINTLFLQYPVSAICLYPAHRTRASFGHQLLAPTIHPVQADPLPV